MGHSWDVAVYVSDYTSPMRPGEIERRSSCQAEGRRCGDTILSIGEVNVICSKYTLVIFELVIHYTYTDQSYHTYLYIIL